MKRIHQHSQECDKTEMDLFTLPPTAVTLQKGKFVEYHPLSSLTDTGPIEFYVPGSGDHYLDLPNMQLYIKCKITNTNGADLDAGDKVGPVNLFLHSLFSQVDVLLNDKLVSGSTSTYPYKAYMETLLTHGNGVKTSELTAGLFYKDTPGHMDSGDPTTTGHNVGLKARYEFTKESHSVDMIGRLHIDICHQNRLLVSGVSLKIKLIRAKNNFCLMSSATNPTFKVVIQDATLRVRQVQPSPTAILMHAQMLRKVTAKYPITRTDCKMFTIPTGNQNFTKENLYLGQIPKKLCLAFTRNQAFYGDYKYNPYNFGHWDFSFLNVMVNGESLPGKPLQLNYESSKGQNFITAYYNMFSGLGGEDGNQITRTDFSQGFAVYVFDLTPDLTTGDHFNLIQRGTLSLELGFKKALSETVSAIVFSELDNLIEIDESRNVLFDFTV